MNWIPDLIKHITTSNKLMFAILITSMIMLVEPVYIPISYSIPENWRWVPMSAAIFSFVMLLLSFLNLTWCKITRLQKEFGSVVFVTNLCGFELELLKYLGEHFGEKSMDLDTLNYEHLNRLDVLAARDSLADKGLISINDWSSNLIYITSKGRAFLTKNIKL